MTINIKKSLPALLLAALLSSLTNEVSAGDLVGKEPGMTLAELAATKREAVLRLIVWQTPRERNPDAWSIGVFISDDGLALVDLQGLVKQKQPTAEVADGKRVEFGRILGVFPEQELALMKFDHHPKTWVSLASEEPEIGETLALLPLDSINQWENEVPVVLGPVMAKRSSTTPNLRVTRFTKALSLGAGLSPVQRAALGPGCFAINRQGKLVAFTNGTQSQGRQVLIFLAPVVQLAAQIDKLTEGGADIGHPLPQKINPIDPAALDPNFHPLNLAWSRGDWKAFEQLLKILQSRHPKSHLLKSRAHQLKLHALQENIAGDLSMEFPPPDPKSPKPQQVQEWSTRAAILMGRGEIAAAIEEYKSAIALSPKDYPDDRAILAKLYENSGRGDDAERLLREVYECSSDSIVIVEMFERFLSQRGKFEESQKMTDRVWELEEIYKRP